MVSEILEACSLSITGEASLGVAVSYPFVGEPSGEDTISSITGGSCLEVLVFMGAANRKDFLVGLGVGLDRADGRCEEAKEDFDC